MATNFKKRHCAQNRKEGRESAFADSNVAGFPESFFAAMKKSFNVYKCSLFLKFL